MSAETVVVVGPGKAFGHKLCNELVLRGKDVLIIGRRMPEYAQARSVRFLHADLLDLDCITERLNAIAQQSPHVMGVIYNAASSNTKTLDELKGLTAAQEFVIDAQIGEGVVYTYNAFKGVLAANGGNFIATSGDFANKAHPEHLGLSVCKAVQASCMDVIAVDAEAHGIATNSVMIEGSATQRLPQIVQQLADLACAHT